MTTRSVLFGCALATALVGSAAIANADTPKSASQDCFFARNWQGSTAPDGKTLYLRVDSHDVYRVDLQGDSFLLRGPNWHLINREHGPSTICSPIDLDLQVSDGSGFVEPLIAKSIVKLTPQQIAAIPKKFVP